MAFLVVVLCLSSAACGGGGDEIAWDRSAMLRIGDDLYICREMAPELGSEEYESRLAKIEKKGTLVGTVESVVAGDQIPAETLCANAEEMGAELYSLPNQDGVIYAKTDAYIAEYLREEVYEEENQKEKERRRR